jgi:hypothetical protein
MKPLGENYREYTTIDKSSWKEGPWDEEPDKTHTSFHTARSWLSS